ncbi:hypothetical protein F5884DRAFT_780149 [Xylogone sp. PMI_703]|nr:hypothetical protein F5884DRAFT_780149 [Xylogone sp. PMI_703]
MHGYTFQTMEAQQDVERKVHMLQEPSRGTSNFQPSPLLSPEIIERCLYAFFAYKYPIMPILDREETYSSVHYLHNSPSQYSFITALCVFVMLQTEIGSSSSGPRVSSSELREDSILSADFLIKETFRARKCYDYIDDPSLATVQTSFFLFAVFFAMGKDSSAWFYIRESMTMLQLLRLHEEATYLAMTDARYATYCRRTFWLLFITERAYALQRHCPLTLKRTILLPTVEPGPEATILSGFLDLVALFQNFNDKFVSLWNWPADSTTSPQSLILLQNILECAIPNASARTQIQQADLLITRLWLKTIVWQLCVSKGFLSSKSATECMSFNYPVTIARDLLLVSRLLPLAAFQAHGVGILEKIFDIGCSLADVLLIHPNIVCVSMREIGPRDYLMELMRILDMDVGGGNSKYLRLLAAKADECLEVTFGRSVHSSESVHPGVQGIEEDETYDD